MQKLTGDLHPIPGKPKQADLTNAEFVIKSDYVPAGDQPQAISEIVDALNKGERYTCLLGVTGSGKTFTMANVIEKVQRPCLVLAPNKTLAAQLAAELREFFPNNSVVYFVSYYDYYQPEAYVPSSDTFIEKDASINEEVEKLRHAATSSLLSRRDCIVVASVSCIYGIGSPADYAGMAVFIATGTEIDRNEFLRSLIDIQYERNDFDLKRGCFRVRGDSVDVFPPYGDNPVRIEFWGDEIESICEVDKLSLAKLSAFKTLYLWPASHYVSERPKIDRALKTIREELSQRVLQFNEENKFLESQRLQMRVNYDLEMLEALGSCSGIENYSRHIDGRLPGEAAYTLLDYFPEDFICIVDESHVTLPQVRGMYEGDRSRKTTLAEHGFRLPSCLDNRPLRFDEFESKINQFVYVSATPGDYELKVCTNFVEQIIRPTGLLDPSVEVRTQASQIDDIIDEAIATAKKKQRVLITTLTKKMAEDLTEHLLNKEVKARYMHSDVSTLDRVEILRELRRGTFDVLVGINLLREGLDLPEVALVAILDADKEGFLRNYRSLIQTIGRAARNCEGRVIMYADKITDSMNRAISETNRRREIQAAFNEKHGIVPKSVKKGDSDILDFIESEVTTASTEEINMQLAGASRAQIESVIERLQTDMIEASDLMDFELAAKYRDQIVSLRSEIEGKQEGDILKSLKKSARKGSAYGRRKR